MEDETSYNRSTFAKPLVDPLDAAIEQMEAEMSGQAGPDPEKDEETGRNATAVQEPEDNDFEDDDETDEANTPATDNDFEDDDSQDSRQTKEQATQPTSGKKKGQAQDSDDDSKLSRSRRGKLITELRQELEREQEAKRVLEESLRTQREAEERLNKEIERALGSDEEYQRAVNDGLAGDAKASERARIWKANREFFEKLKDKATRDGTAEFMDTYWREVNGLPGVTQEALKAPNLAAILKNMYDAGVNSVKGSSTEEIEKLKTDLDTWKGRYRALKAKAGGAKTSPLGGGGSTVTAQTADWRKKYIDPKTGLLSDEAEAIVEQYGFAALENPKLIKR